MFIADRFHTGNNAGECLGPALTEQGKQTIQQATYKNNDDKGCVLIRVQLGNLSERGFV